MHALYILLYRCKICNHQFKNMQKSQKGSKIKTKVKHSQLKRNHENTTENGSDNPCSRWNRRETRNWILITHISLVVPKVF